MGLVMNSGPINGASNVARNVVEAMRSQPLMLMLLIIILFLIGFIAWSEYNRTRARNENVKLVLEYQTTAAKLLSQCTPAQTAPPFSGQIQR
jgi:hypothetical protein